MDSPCSWIFEEEPLYRRYRKLHLIGIGKYSEVYAGEDVVTHQEVALKIVNRRKLQDEEAAREEYRMISALCHRNIISGLAFFKSSPQKHLDTLVITRINGIQLFENFIQNECTERELKTFFKQLLSAIDYLISQGVVHGDIKPENILVDNENAVRLIDFGPSLPDPEFSAPEVHLSKFSHSADIWSLGVVLYAVLSGVSPFLDDCPEETLTNKCEANYSFPSEYFVGVSRGALLLIGLILVPKPEHRPLPHTLLSQSWFQEEDSGWVTPGERLLSFIFRRRKSVYSGL